MILPMRTGVHKTSDTDFRASAHRKEISGTGVILKEEYVCDFCGKTIPYRTPTSSCPEVCWRPALLSHRRQTRPAPASSTLDKGQVGRVSSGQVPPARGALDVYRRGIPRSALTCSSRGQSSTN